MIKKYIKKPVEIVAIQYDGSNSKEIKAFVGEHCTIEILGLAAYEAGAGFPLIEEIIIHTLEGDMKVSKGDYIIKGVKGEFYPCKPDIFNETYQETDCN